MYPNRLPAGRPRDSVGVTVLDPAQDLDSFFRAVEVHVAAGAERILVPTRPEEELRELAAEISSRFEMSW